MAPGDETVRNARITGFMTWLAGSSGLRFGGYDQLWHRSATQPGQFWAAIWDYFEVLADRGPGPILADGPMPMSAGSTVPPATTPVTR